jgi:hypothetical protein
LIENNREMTLILAKALDFFWETAMSLLFLHAKDHRIAQRDLDGMREGFTRVNVQTSRSVLEFYRSRKVAAAADCEDRRLPQPVQPMSTRSKRAGRLTGSEVAQI